MDVISKPEKIQNLSNMNSTDITSVRETLQECFKKQMLELEIMQCMLPNPGEFVLNNPHILDQMKDFIDGRTDFIPQHLDYLITLKLKDNIEISINLPSHYPIEEPDIFVRCNSLNRIQQAALNNDLIEYMKELDKGETCVFSLTSWIQDNIDKYFCEDDNNVEKNAQCIKTCKKFSRIWIYSHHIYNKRKRDAIVTTARELDLTGFSSPGKPGVVCIEGYEENCMEWWKYIKSLSWKKIMIRNTETVDVVNLEKQRKFNMFNEICFENTLNKNNKHMDMKTLSRFLEEHGLLEDFKSFFGFNTNTNA